MAENLGCLDKIDAILQSSKAALETLATDQGWESKISWKPIKKNTARITFQQKFLLGIPKNIRNGTVRISEETHIGNSRRTPEQISSGNPREISERAPERKSDRIPERLLELLEESWQIFFRICNGIP